MKAMFCHALLCGLLGGCIASAWADENKNDAEVARIKAVYIYHFASFAEWPPERTLVPEKEVRLCAVGGGPTVGQLTQLDGRDLGNGRHLQVAQLRLDQVTKTCHMLFVGELPRADSDLAGGRLRGEPILLVGEQSGFAQNGGMIEMFLRDDKVRMRINLSMVRAAGIMLSSKLLRLAEIVEAP